jgi:hypothetical protein
MGALLMALADAVHAVVQDVLGESDEADVTRSLTEVRMRRQRCVQGAARRARLALGQDEHADDLLEGEWLSYTAILVQVDRIVADLSAPLPT